MIYFYVFFIVFFFLILQAVAFLTLMERHLLGGSQSRLGPNKVGYLGFLQCMFDGLKLIKKEYLLIFNSYFVSFFMVPVMGFISMFFLWFTLPYFFSFFSFYYSSIFMLCVISFSSYFVFLSGIFSNSKYGFLGGIRSSIQSFSYEIAFSIYVLCFLIFYNEFFFVSGFYFIFIFLVFPFFFLILMDLHRVPFDFSECEGELVSGYNVEFSSVGFALLFLSEYGNLLYFMMLFVVLFFNYSFLLYYLMLMVIIFIRSSFPRYRFDKMMSVCWFDFLPYGIYLFFFFLLFIIY
uniref:NADH dehydrogenase subunit 1 n=1 Tax=Metathelazia capsulata TaxID=2964486 RepID=UPI002E79E30E|nr:NADH dehydrogenase subunit 1 [Metathelazia capsulata]WPS93535.1 NADH dehydrogenase subunit 1 [Metathelazia capsulata]